MNSKLIKVISIVVDKHNITLYKEDGSTLKFSQGQIEIKELMKKMISDINQNGFTLVNEEDLLINNHFSKTEKLLNKVIKFFSITKNKIHSLFSSEDLPVRISDEDIVMSIIDNAENSNSVDFRKCSDDVVIAVTEDKKIYTGMEKLDLQIKAVSKGIGSEIGLGNFFKRMQGIKREHSLKDLLTFVEKSELPIAEDGSILAYKLLNKTNDPDVFKDCHTGNVLQKVGSIVEMDESLVDPDRRNKCSNGLHIARRAYLKSFGGNVCVLCKVAPEDVIAVPSYDPNKVRTMRYFIVAKLSDTDMQNVKQDLPLKDTNLLGNVIKGIHTEPIERVHIGANEGGNITITNLKPTVKEIILDESLSNQSLDVLEKIESFNSIDPIKLAKEHSKVNNQKPTHKERIRFLLDQENFDAIDAQEIIGIKRKIKRSWKELGISEKEKNKILKLIS